MYLLVAATEMEMRPLRSLLEGQTGVDLLVTGVGPMETAVTLTGYLAGDNSPPKGVICFGVAGAFPDTGVAILDICFARKEILGDLGICSGERITSFKSRDLPVRLEHKLDGSLLDQAESILTAKHVPHKTGTFVTVNCASGTAGRGVFLRDRHQAICENMEGAAVARVCQEFGLACLEMRCVSNLVQDRDPQTWKLAEACRKSAETAALLVTGLRAV